MSQTVPTIITTEANDDNSAGPSRVASPHSAAPSFEINVESPDNQVLLSPTSPTTTGGPLLRAPSSGSHASSSLSSAGPHTPSFDGESNPDPHIVPPSPTISQLSSPFEQPSTTQLRYNDPDINSGKGSLLLLPSGKGLHERKLSWTTSGASAEDGTEPDHAAIGPPTPVDELTIEETRAPSSTSSRRGKGHKGKENEDAQRKRDEEQKGTKDTQLDIRDNDESFDPTPFGFKPKDLADMLDRRKLEQLEAWGGIEGLLAGLGTNSRRGLSSDGVPQSVVVHGEKGYVRSDSIPPLLPAAADERLAAMADHRKFESGSQPPGVGGGDEKCERAQYNPAAYTTSLDDRRRVYGSNVIPEWKSKNLLQLMWLALKDRVLVILCIAAVVSLALGLYQDFGTPREHTICPDGTKNCLAPQVNWVEGVTILVAVAIVVIVGSVNDWQKELQFRALNAKKDDRSVKVLRDGIEKVINVKDVVVGDVCLMEPGEIIPVDGVYLFGHNVRCDESAVTGESDTIKKATYDDCIAEYRAHTETDGRGEQLSRVKKDPFVISGSKVLEGIGSYVVIAVGERSMNGRILMGLRGVTPNTPLQLKLNVLAELIAKIGVLASLVLFTALMIKFFVELHTQRNRTSSEKAINFINNLIISVTVVVIAVPEGLPLAVTLALAFATKRMTRQNLLVRVLSSCETMANASVVCTDKTGTLTQNVMTVVAGALGVNGKFVRDLEQNQTRQNVGEERVVSREELDITEEEGTGERKHKDDFAIDITNVNSILTPQLQTLFNEAICINSTAFEDIDPVTHLPVFVGSKTESALLRFAKELGWTDYRRTRDGATVVQMIPFSSERKAMGVAIKLANGKYRLYLKGASEILTKECKKHVVVHQSASMDRKGIETHNIGSLEKDNISRTIIFYANQMLRTIALCYRDFDHWPPAADLDEPDNVPYRYLAQELTLIGIVGIEDPLRSGVREAVAQCQKAGVAVKMCTGDNVLTARSIAIQCGIYTAGGIIMEGPAFRSLNHAELLEIVPRLQVLARSSPEDKKFLITKLKQLGEIVGVTGDGTNDSLALKEAHVGFSMGIAGTEVAKEASDIIVMDDNFASIVSAIMWGRCVNDSVKKFLQFQISVNISAVIVTFITAVASHGETSALTAVQLLWINLIMDTFAALALATDPAHPGLLNHHPDGLTAPLFSVDMYKQIIGQSVYQIVVILLFHFAGMKIFKYHGLSEYQQNQKSLEIGTLVFNAFVFCQIFNSLNSRRLDNKLNVFENILTNWYFIFITLLEVGVQIMIVFVGGSAFQVTKLSGRDWGISLALGFVALPLGALIRCIPNKPVEKFFKFCGLIEDPKANLFEEWNTPAINQVRDNLATFAKIRGGRLRTSSFVGMGRSQKLRKAGIQLPSLLAMVPTLVASTVGAGWVPARAVDLADPAHDDPSRSSTALYNGAIQIHPDTPLDDPLWQKFGTRSQQV
ncbi:calcium-translocating P-type ATPase [Cantharellus anzutake]|uniref:calcium-translocating P-type ATPase n=1 Tax=Cantharellus anzutake TaxID=1750568 RepID=UPI001903762E|nr:calcium-translocating P-type ATPase [Cantharellus anzutake]KAF8340446.1 calcium-translocating P-type ATPase [Cantharellus anzutake]